MAKNTVVDIQTIWYGDLIITSPLKGPDVKAFTKATTTKKIDNVHATTWAYSQDEASVTDYINQLNNTVYYRDSQPGATNVTFSIGQYDFEQKADLMGGTATATEWEAPINQGIIYKGFVAKTKDGTYFAFPKAQISAVEGMIEDKVHGINVTVTPIDPGIAGLSNVKWFAGSVVV